MTEQDGAGLGPIATESVIAEAKNRRFSSIPELTEPGTS